MDQNRFALPSPPESTPEALRSRADPVPTARAEPRGVEGSQKAICGPEPDLDADLDPTRSPDAAELGSEPGLGARRGASAPVEEDAPAPLVLFDRDALVRSATAYARESRAPRTRIEYAKHWAHFRQFCALAGASALPAAPQTIALYLAARADDGLKVATISVALSAIARAHRLAGHPSPTAHPLASETWKGIRRRLGIAPCQKHPVDADNIRAMIDDLPAGLRGQRDRALITLGFAGAFRRSELVALEVADVAFVAEGLEALVRRSKTDQEGRGLLKVVAYGSDPASCPVRSLKDWLELAGVSAGPVFRAVSRHERVAGARMNDHSVAVIIKRAARRAGLSAELLAGHSLRAGFVTEAKKHGADDASIMDQTGHKSLAMMSVYTRRIKKWAKPASAKLGL